MAKKRVRKVSKEQKQRNAVSSKLWYANNPEKARDSFLNTTYGISLADYEKQLREQGGTCALCKLPETTLGPKGKVRVLSVDHCHKTGKFRGLLCNSCNRAIGYLRDDPNLCVKANVYLRRSKYMTLEQSNFIAATERYEQVKKELDAAREELEKCALALGYGAYVQDPETSLVYKIVKPNGSFVYYRDIEYVRTAKDGERAGTLSKKEAEGAGFILKK